MRTLTENTLITTVDTFHVFSLPTVGSVVFMHCYMRKLFHLSGYNDITLVNPQPILKPMQTVTMTVSRSLNSFTNPCSSQSDILSVMPFVSCSVDIVDIVDIACSLLF